MKERVWARLSLWMAARDIADHVPDGGGNSGTIAIPIPLLRRLRSTVEYYEQEHGSFRRMPYAVRVREGLKLLWPWY